MSRTSKPEPHYATRAEFENRPTNLKEGLPIILGVIVVVFAIVFTTYLLSKGA